MDPRRLRLLLELSRRGTMRAVADHLRTTTSTVSQQIAALSRELRTDLLEADGRLVRLTPAGRRLAEHAVVILAAIDAARDDLSADAEPAGRVRVAGFLTAVRELVLPCVRELAETHPSVQVVICEHEPAEALALLGDDRVDLALTYDYDLAPALLDEAFETSALWTTPWALGVPADAVSPPRPRSAIDTVLAFRDHDWIGNSRNSADEQVITVLTSMAGFSARLTHQCDSLDLVEELIASGMGVGLLPVTRTPRRGVALLPLASPSVHLRAYLNTRRGQSGWAPLALLCQQLTSRLERFPLRSR